MTLQPHEGNQPVTMSTIAQYVADYDSLSGLMRLAVMTDFVPKSFRPEAFLPKDRRPTQQEWDAALEKSVASATIGAHFGMSLGVGADPFSALQGVHVVNGRPGLYAEVMVALVQSRGHEVWTEDVTDKRAVVCGQRKGTQHVERVSIDMGQAQSAGWTRNPNYRNNPQDMLYARAASRVCRRIAADALKGIRTAEELEDDAAVSDAPNGTRTVQRAPARKAVEAVKAPTEPTPTDPTQAAARVVSAPYADPPAEDVNLPPLPGEEPSGPVRDPSADAVTDAQLRKLGAVFTSLGVKGTGEREQRLRAASRVVGRELTTSKDLTKDEARLLIDTLEAADAEHVAYLLDDHVETPEVEAVQSPLPDDDADTADELEGGDDT